MSKTHKEFLAYIDSLKAASLDPDTIAGNQNCLNLIIAVADKLAKDFKYLANFISDMTDEEFLGKPVLRCDNDYTKTIQVCNTDQDDHVLETIQNVMKEIRLRRVFLKFDETQQQYSNLNMENLRQLRHELGFEVYIFPDVHTRYASFDEMYVFVDIGELLIQLN